MKYVKSKGKKRTTGKRRVSKKKIVSVPKSVKSYVKSAIHRMAETKQSSVQLDVTGFNSSIGSTDLARLLPVIQQGVAQDTRLGSEIRPIKLVIRGYVLYNTGSYLPSRLLGVRMFMWQNKSVRSYATALSSTNVNLLDLGGDGSTFNGTPLNYNTPHNTDQFHFYCDKKFRIMKPFGYTNSSTGATAMTDVDKSLYHPFTITIKPGQNGFPSVLKYDNASGSNQYPTNFAPYWSIGYADLLNYSPDLLDAQLYGQFIATLYYEDM